VAGAFLRQSFSNAAKTAQLSFRSRWPDDVLPIVAEVNQELDQAMRCVQSTHSEFLEAVKSFNPEQLQSLWLL